MKTRFEINQEIFDQPSLKECIEYYEKYYKQYGFIYDEKDESVYKLYDKEFNLNEGDNVNLYGVRTVAWKCVDIENEIIIYTLEGI